MPDFIIDYTIMFIALLISLLLLFLICFCSPQSMKNYKTLLLCGWFADFTFNVFAILGRPLYFFHSGTLYMLSSMFTSNFDIHWVNKFGVIMWVYGFMQLMIMPAVQFLVRYLMIVKDIHLRTIQLLLILSLWYLLPISYTILAYFTCSDAPLYQEIAFEVFGKNLMTTRSVNGTLETRFVLACDTTSNLMVGLCIHAFVQIVITYGSISYFGYKIYQQLKLTTLYSSQMQQVQRQITKILVFQTITPPIIGGLPLIYVFFMAFFKLDSFALTSERFDRFFSLVSIINPIMSIYFVKHYRVTVARFLCISYKTFELSNRGTINPTNWTV